MARRSAHDIHRLLAPAAFVSVVLLSAATARAGGLEIPDLGTVAIGRGAAFVARADNLSAFHYNPALFTHFSL